MHLVHTEQSGLFTINIYIDPDPLNPRTEYDGHLGTMVCSHRRYRLGDKPYNQDIDEIKNIIDSPGIIALPLYLYDHSGITIKCSPFSCPWDSGQVGYIYCSVKDAEKEYSTKERSFDSWLDMVKSRLASEVEDYDNYLTGNCYGYEILDQFNEHVDSCWGFLGNTNYCLDEAKSSAHHYNEKLARKNELACI